MARNHNIGSSFASEVACLFFAD